MNFKLCTSISILALVLACIGLQSEVNVLQNRKAPEPTAVLTSAPASTAPNPIVLTCMRHEAEPFQMFDGYGAPIVTGACYGNALTSWGANMAVMTKVFGTGITWSPWTPRQAARIERDPSVLSCVNGNNDWIAPGPNGLRTFHCKDGHWVR